MPRRYVPHPRSSRPAAGSAAPVVRPPLGWSEVVARLSLVADGQRERLSVLHRLSGWRPFLSAWSTSSAFLVKCGGPASLDAAEYDAGTFDQNLAWAWGVVEPYVDAALHTVDSRCQLSSALTYQMFEILRGAALVLPDGSALPIVRDLAEQHDRAERSSLVAASVLAAWKVQRVQAAMAPPAPSTSAPPPGP